MDITQYHFEIRRHAVLRAMERGITPEMVEATLKGGRVERFGRNCMRFRKAYKGFEVICIDQMIGSVIKIVTIERR
jgi:hypothetical protein